eukprot:CAMPEP_0171277518 /NCGR_PEP_ID=MMETSP0790-20130122/64390_1 /TAXON_ID=2925 /ORGANISM="Alexandrium catenella, Strain OF101" /LENGTH=352 /DNA_ID=CAMNT_0011746637 /DNA_START=63 /DNA_END=1122 /DNA_ORIENTATION=+
MGSTCSSCFDQNTEAKLTVLEPETSPEATKVAKITDQPAEAIETTDAPIDVPEDVGGKREEVVEDAPQAAAGGKFTLVLHSAVINRSFAKIGHMDPYAIIEVEDKEVGRSKPDKSAHKKPHWESVGGDRHDQAEHRVRVPRARERAGPVDAPSDTGHGARQDSEALQPAVPGHTSGARGDYHPQAEVLGEGTGRGEAEAREEAQQAYTDETQSALQPLMGSWKCVETHGLDAFLKATGVGVFQRKIAGAAKWPAWEYQLEGDQVKFTNHSAIGVLLEIFPLRKDYDWKDGHGNPMSCKAVWTKSDEGGTLSTERTGKLASYKEERKITDNRLEFTLTHGSGVAWGRVFEKVL